LVDDNPPQQVLHIQILPKKRYGPENNIAKLSKADIPTYFWQYFPWQYLDVQHAPIVEILPDKDRNDRVTRKFTLFLFMYVIRCSQNLAT